jgi:uncharacterized protein YjbI with pentapeptide repeats
MKQYNYGTALNLKKIKIPGKKGVDYWPIRLKNKGFIANIPLNWETAQFMNSCEYGNLNVNYCIGWKKHNNYWKIEILYEKQVPVYVVDGFKKWVVMVQDDNKSFEIWDKLNSRDTSAKNKESIEGFSVKKELISGKSSLYDDIRKIQAENSIPLWFKAAKKSSDAEWDYAFNFLTWTKGTYKGDFLEGDFIGGTFEGGIFSGDTFESSTFKSGTFKKGKFINSKWIKGKWISGTDKNRKTHTINPNLWNKYKTFDKLKKYYNITQTITEDFFNDVDLEILLEYAEKKYFERKNSLIPIGYGRDGVYIYNTIINKIPNMKLDLDDCEITQKKITRDNLIIANTNLNGYTINSPKNSSRIIAETLSNCKFTNINVEEIYDADSCIFNNCTIYPDTNCTFKNCTFDRKTKMMRDSELELINCNITKEELVNR